MKNADNLTIAILLATAAILGGLVLTTDVVSQPAYASSTGSKDGDYVMTVSTYDQNTDLVFVLDIDTNRLNAYTVDINTKSIRMGDSVDLARLFRAKP